MAARIPAEIQRIYHRQQGENPSMDGLEPENRKKVLKIKEEGIVEKRP